MKKFVNIKYVYAIYCTIGIQRTNYLEAFGMMKYDEENILDIYLFRFFELRTCYYISGNITEMPEFLQVKHEKI